MAAWGKGSIAAIAGVLVLAGVLGWRLLSDDGRQASESPAHSDMSLPPSLEELEARAEADPDNAARWQELGIAALQASRFAQAAQAYERAVAADPQSSVLWSALGEATAKASNTLPMPARALEAFRRAVALDPQDHRARYFLATQKDLEGDHEGAIADWLALLADTPPGAPWETDVVRTIEQVGAINEIEVADRIAAASGTRDLLPASANPSLPGPTQEQMAAAAALSPGEQQTMAEGMVSRLANRIASDGGSLEEWMMLMRSYQQLGRTGEARRTRDRAISAHPDSRESIEAMASRLGIV